MLKCYLMESFSDWMVKELDNRGWSQADLSRASGLTDATISRVLSETRNPGKDFCVKVAKAFVMSPEDVMRKAGILPDMPNLIEDMTVKQIYDAVRMLDIDEREELLRYVLWRIQEQSRRKDKPNSALSGS